MKAVVVVPVAALAAWILTPIIDLAVRGTIDARARKAVRAETGPPPPTRRDTDTDTDRDTGTDTDLPHPRRSTESGPAAVRGRATA